MDEISARSIGYVCTCKRMNRMHMKWKRDRKRDRNRDRQWEYEVRLTIQY